MAHGSAWLSIFSTVCFLLGVLIGKHWIWDHADKFQEALWFRVNMGTDGWTIFQIGLSVSQPELMNTPENTGLSDRKNKCNQQKKLHYATLEACLRL